MVLAVFGLGLMLFGVGVAISADLGIALCLTGVLLSLAGPLVISMTRGW